MMEIKNKNNNKLQTYNFYFTFFRVKQLQNSLFADFVIDPDQSLSYSIIQDYVDKTTPAISPPLLANWAKTLEHIPSTFSYTHIYEYLVKRKTVVLSVEGEEVTTFQLPVADKPLIKGYNFYASGNVKECRTNSTDNFCHFWTTILASMLEENRTVKIVLDSSGVILSSHCSCPVGKGGKCNHVASSLFAALEYRLSQQTASKTGVSQTWHQPSRAGKKKAQPKKVGKFSDVDFPFTNLDQLRK